MNIRTRVSLSILSLVFAVLGFAQDPFKESREEWNRRLQRAAEYLIVRGLHDYDVLGKKSFDRKLRFEFLVSPYIPSYTDMFDYTRFGIVLGGTYFDSACYYREETEDGLYELWTIQTSYDPDCGIQNTTEFLFCRSQSFRGVREIQHRTNVLPEKYVYDDGYEFIIPMENERIKYNILRVLELQGKAQPVAGGDATRWRS